MYHHKTAEADTTKKTRINNCSMKHIYSIEVLNNAH